MKDHDHEHEHDDDYDNFMNEHALIKNQGIPDVA